MKEIQELIKAKDFASAEKIINDLLAQKPNDPVILFQKGFLEASRSNFEKAQSIFDYIFSIEPKHYMALFNSALIDEKNKATSKALIKYNQVLILNPNYEPAINSVRKLSSMMNSSQDNKKEENDHIQNDLGKLKYEWSPTSSSGIPYIEAKILLNVFIFLFGCGIFGFAIGLVSEGNVNFITIYVSSLFFLIFFFLMIRYIRHKKNKYKVYENGMELYINKPFFKKKLKLYYVKISPETVQIRSPFPLTLTDDAYILVQVGVSPLHPQMFEYAKLYTCLNFEETDKIYNYITTRIMTVREDKKKTML